MKSIVIGSWLLIGMLMGGEAMAQAGSPLYRSKKWLHLFLDEYKMLKLRNWFRTCP